MADKEKKACEYCGSTDNVTSEVYFDHQLCDKCWDKYDNKTGYCSLDCCISGHCDESC